MPLCTTHLNPTRMAVGCTSLALLVGLTLCGCTAPTTRDAPLPSTFPADIPLVAGAPITGATDAGSGGSPTWTVTLDLERVATPAEALGLIDSTLEAGGYNETFHDASSERGEFDNGIWIIDVVIRDSASGGMSAVYTVAAAPAED